MTSALHDHRWLAAMIHKSPKWVLEHLDELPHRRVGRSVMFTDDDYAAYVASVAREPELMRPTRVRRSA